MPLLSAPSITELAASISEDPSMQKKQHMQTNILKVILINTEYRFYLDLLYQLNSQRVLLLSLRFDLHELYSFL